LTVAAREIKIA